MFFRPEIKDFTKNTLILTLIFTLVLHLSWSYIAPYLGMGASASTNDMRFSQTSTTYLGSIATALSLSIGKQDKKAKYATIDTNSEINISIRDVIEDPEVGEKKLIWGNMAAISSYRALLAQDIATMLDQAPSREVALDDHIALLRGYGNRTNERMRSLGEQIAELQAIISANKESIAQSQALMTSSYTSLDYAWVDRAISTYADARSSDSRAVLYLSYLDRFQRMYTSLQAQNRKILDTLINNRDAIIKRAIIVIPDSGTEMMRELNLIQSESEYKKSKTTNP
jgi:hypothetical protein